MTDRLPLTIEILALDHDLPEVLDRVIGGTVYFEEAKRTGQHLLSIADVERGPHQGYRILSNNHEVIYTWRPLELRGPDADKAARAGRNGSEAASDSLPASTRAGPPQCASGGRKISRADSCPARWRFWAWTPGAEGEEMSRNIPWSDEDDQQLRSLALSGFSLAEIARQMVRVTSSVRSRALKLGIAIARDRNPMQGPLKAAADSSRQSPDID
jgi:hypothetical protein